MCAQGNDSMHQRRALVINHKIWLSQNSTDLQILSVVVVVVVVVSPGVLSRRVFIARVFL